MNSSLSTLECAQLIKPYEGDPKQCKDWVKSIEKCACPADRVGLLAFKTSRGAVSDFIQRFFTNAPGGQQQWDALKKELSARFAEMTDSQHAFMLLLKCRQNKDENVQVYAERLLNLAEEAFPEGGPSVQRQLVGAFADGLASDRLRLKVVRDNPATVQEVINTARGEQNLFKRFNLRTGRENFSVSDGGTNQWKSTTFGQEGHLIIKTKST